MQGREAMIVCGRQGCLEGEQHLDHGDVASNAGDLDELGARAGHDAAGVRLRLQELRGHLHEAQLNGEQQGRSDGSALLIEVLHSRHRERIDAVVAVGRPRAGGRHVRLAAGLGHRVVPALRRAPSGRREVPDLPPVLAVDGGAAAVLVIVLALELARKLVGAVHLRDARARDEDAGAQTGIELGAVLEQGREHPLGVRLNGGDQGGEAV
mmetsp:Transcript_56860/g.163246  ORF Transcript_56860/g.163246 Transcript_56860/m.163246 type:complete len:210 (-) Transcript_56860:814-1443(-)